MAPSPQRDSDFLISAHEDRIRDLERTVAQIMPSLARLEATISHGFTAMQQKLTIIEQDIDSITKRDYETEKKIDRLQSRDFERRATSAARKKWLYGLLAALIVAAVSGLVKSL